MFPKTVTHASSVVAQNMKKDLVRNVSNIFYQPDFQAAPPKYPLCFWKDGLEQRRAIVLKVMPHTLVGK